MWSYMKLNLVVQEEISPWAFGSDELRSAFKIQYTKDNEVKKKLTDWAVFVDMLMTQLNPMAEMKQKQFNP